MKEKNMKELLLLCELRKNARRGVTSIGRALGMPVSTVHEKVKNKLDSFVRKYTCILDYGRLGFGCRVQAALRVKGEDDIARMKTYLLRHQNVNSVYRINNGYNLLVEAIFRDLGDAEDFWDKLEREFRITEKKVFYILEDLGSERFLTDHVHAELVSIQAGA